MAGRSSNYRVRFNTNTQSHSSMSSMNMSNMSRNSLHRQPGGSGKSDYQLKVGGVVVCSWAGAPNRNAGHMSNGIHSRMNRSGTGGQYYNRYSVVNARGRNSANTRLQRNVPHNQHVSSLARTISRSTYGVKVNRTRRTRKYNRGNKGKKEETDEKEEEEEKGEGTVNDEEVAEGEDSADAEAANQNGYVDHSLCS